MPFGEHHNRHPISWLCAVALSRAHDLEHVLNAGTRSWYSAPPLTIAQRENSQVSVV